MSVWSEPVNGLRGRLLVEPEELEQGFRHTVYLELKNTSSTAVAVVNQPAIRADLRDPSGKPIGTAGRPMSGPAPGPEWAVIPRDAYIGFRVDMRTVGVPTREHEMALLAVGGSTWALTAGRYLLTATIVFERREGGLSGQWTGELRLPPVEVTVTRQMLQPDRP